ncbi:MAG: tetratricopeptide repeat protein [Pseudorhodoplanes sp.]
MIVALVWLSGPVAPAAAQDAVLCESATRAATDDNIIRGSTFMIEALFGGANSLSDRALHATLLRDRANAYRRQRDWARAMADFELAITLNPRDRINLVCRAEAHDQMGNPARAAADRAAAARLPRR